MNREDFNYYKRYSKNIKVFVQIKPCTTMCWKYVKLLEDRKSLYVRSVQDFSKGNPDRIPHYWLFNCDGVLYSLNPKEIYETVTEGLLECALDGNNIVISAYGQTGTGKSTTIHGLYNAYKNRGIILRILSDLFDLKKKYKNKTKIKFSTSCVEVSKHWIIDLLSNDRSKIFRPFKSVSKVKIDTLAEGYRSVFMSEVQRNMCVKSPYLSHLAPSIFTIHIKNSSLLNANPVDKCSKIHIIDMSGADTGGNDSCIYKNPQDVGAANLAKTQLEQLLLIFHKHQTKNNKLLRGLGCLVEYLSDSLKPHNLLRFIAHIELLKPNLTITISHLRFAHTAKCIAPAKLVPFTMTSDRLDVENMKHHLNYFVNQNYLDSMIMNDDLSKNLTLPRAQQMQNIIEDFINNKSNNLAVLNVSDAQTVLNIFKKVYDKNNTDLLNNMQEKDELILKLQELLSPATKRENKYSQFNPKEDPTTEKKKKGSEKRSSLRGIEIKSKKSSRVGSVENYGKSIGKTQATNYQGNVIKSRKSSLNTQRSKGKSKKSPKSSEAAQSNLTSPNNSKITINDPELENSMVLTLKAHEEAWKLFSEEEYYDALYTSIKNASKEYKDTLEKHNEEVKKIQCYNQRLEAKKEYQMKIQFFKRNKEPGCCTNETQKLEDIENKINTDIIQISSDLLEFKENLLTLQADLKINVDNYNRIKKHVNDCFTKFCEEKFNTNLSTGDPVIDENLLSEEKRRANKKQTILEEEESRKVTQFYTLQAEMFKIFKEKSKNK